MASLKQVVIGTRNKGKIAELGDLLGGTGIRLVGLSDFENVPDVPEDGTSFGENAAKKASAYAVRTDNWAVADDSGLVVPALGGKPGIFSARFAGEGASDAENTAKLLKEMHDLEGVKRSACFVCEMAVADPSGVVILTAKGECCGTISHKPFGTNGFGYDPVFIPDGFSKTFGELPDDVKSKISHRSAAASKIADFFEEFIGRPT